MALVQQAAPLPHEFNFSSSSAPTALPQMSVIADEADAAAALCALPSTSRRVDPKSFQCIWSQVWCTHPETSLLFPSTLRYMAALAHSLSFFIYAQIKECSDRLRELTATSNPAPEPETSLLPLLQRLLGLFNAFNSSVYPPPPSSTLFIGKKKRKAEHFADLLVKGENNLVKSNSKASQRTHSEAIVVKRQKTRRSKPGSIANLRCHHCGERDTPEWRRGPAGPKTLCNACGLQYAKFLREADKREKCRLPLSLVLNS